ncbi:MAG: peptide deformylase [Pirellulales bacterium]|nr:peptide deformylase [Pirellulales bacterium]
MLKIIEYPHPTLRHRSKPLRRVDAELRAMIDQMFDLMYEAKGVGLAANQVDLPYRFFVMNETGDPEQPDAQQVIINPVLSRPKGSAEQEEGCLSLPGVYKPVTRPAQIRLNAYDLRGQEINVELEGMPSRIVQHEADHLDGVLFIDRISESDKREIVGALEELSIDFDAKQHSGEIASEDHVNRRLADLERLRC